MAGVRRFIVFPLAVSAAFALSAGGAAAQLAGPDRASFIQSSIASCSATVKQNHPEIPPATITTYCTCMANKEADMTTPADLAYIAAHNAATPEYTQKVQALGPACNAAAGLH